MTIALAAILVAVGFVSGGISIGCLALHLQRRRRRSSVLRYREIL